MEKQIVTGFSELRQLIDTLTEGIENQWSHAVRKQILLLLHGLKNFSRKYDYKDIEAELVAVEATLGYGQGSGGTPDPGSIVEHQNRLLELIDTLDEQPDLVEDNEAEINPQSGQTDIRLVLCNCPGRDTARELARNIVESRLAACINIIANIGSIYWWEGEIQDSAECQLQIKTSESRLQQLIEYIKQHHPDDVPEILAFPVNSGNEDYFDWVNQETHA